jgi:hypothetical protein
MGAGGFDDVGLDRGGQDRSGPFEDGRDDQAGGLEAAGRSEDQDRVAVLGGQQPPAQPAGAAEDHPAGFGSTDA